MRSYGQLATKEVWDREKTERAGRRFPSRLWPPDRVYRSSIPSELKFCFDFPAVPLELQLMVIEYLAFVDLKLLELTSRDMERLVATRTGALNATLFRSAFDLSVLQQALRSPVGNWQTEKEYQGPVKLHPVIHSTAVSVTTRSYALSKRNYVFQGSTGLAPCPWNELKEMDDNATEPCVRQILLAVWNLDWVQLGLIEQSEPLLDLNPGGFTPLQRRIERDDGAPIKVRDLVEAIFTLMDEVRAKLSDVELDEGMWHLSRRNWSTELFKIENECVVLRDSWWQFPE